MPDVIRNVSPLLLFSSHCSFHVVMLLRFSLTHLRDVSSSGVTDYVLRWVYIIKLFVIIVSSSAMSTSPLLQSRVCSFSSCTSINLVTLPLHRSVSLHTYPSIPSPSHPPATSHQHHCSSTNQSCILVLGQVNLGTISLASPAAS